MRCRGAGWWISKAEGRVSVVVLRPVGGGRLTMLVVFDVEEVEVEGFEREEERDGCE